MTFETDAAAVGAAADAKVAQLQGQLDAADALAASLETSVSGLQAQVVAKDATIADLTAKLAADEAILHPAPPPPPPPPPPPVSHLQVGTSPGGGSAANLDAALKDFPAAEVVRVFLGAGLPVPVAGNAIFADAVKRGLEVWVSWNTMPTDAQWTAVLKDWMAAGVPIWWDYRHEVDAPKENAAQFRSEYDHLQAVAETVPGYTASKVHDQCIFMAFLLDPSQPHGVPSSWYPTRPTRWGWDCYNKAALARVIADAKARKLRYVFPEIGCGGANSEAKGDPAGAQWLKDAAASWAAYPPEGLCFFASNSGNGIGIPLTGMPLMVAELTALAKT